MIVPIKLSQIQHTVNGIVPPDLSQCLVFEQPGAVRLTQRIKELEQEKSVQKKQMREARKKHVMLIKDRRLFEGKINEMNETANGMMMKKFGKIVDLEKLDQVVVNKPLEELKDKMRVVEQQCANDLAKWNVSG